MNNSLADKLKSLGVQVGIPERSKTSEPKSPHPVDTVLEGYDVLHEFQTAYVVQKTLPADHVHGIISLQSPVDFTLLTEWAKVPHLKDADRTDFLFLDTETSGLSGGTGAFVFMIGLGFWEPDGQYTITQFFLRDPKDEPGFLCELTEFISGFRALVTFNGKSFDVPMLNSRYIINGLSSPFLQYDHIDLLALARRIWRNRLPSRSLGSLEKEILQFGRSSDDIPGWMVPELYFDYLVSRDARPLAGVFYHNLFDVLSMAGLLLHTGQLLQAPLQNSSHESLDLIAIARLYEDLGRLEEAIPLYEHSLQIGLPQDFFIQTLDRFANIYRKRKEWGKAIPLWEKAVQYKQISACLELAKYYEHEQKEYTTALQWTEIAARIIQESRMGMMERKIQLEELGKRAERLYKKQIKTNKTDVK